VQRGEMITKRSNHMPMFTHIGHEEQAPRVRAEALEPEECGVSTLQRSSSSRPGIRPGGAVDKRNNSPGGAVPRGEKLDRVRRSPPSACGQNHLAQFSRWCSVMMFCSPNIARAGIARVSTMATAEDCARTK